ncbi:L-threonylcarbamoyladenylate synthase type 1 TsaC [Buchnera aphidicola str. APS (Acyrthosiphon pisum)]|nr:dsRNA-binding protein, putative ribosome maturation factor (YrdC) [Buchnera aphidicola str. LL01 (Acyrthosiphon pisum)]ADP66875.1 dsRNA-binding protein, putative ribosome maturation factor (YrdC) [Buchnera aphidicola str. TLW03 (Acyrthosiphon pisum)]ADP67461.1 dsRNA-binding protein, putative ribosome maturation factor (YrdC) [Buchnera aphidicola str. JF99 (Acyrthosiphon pisum)]ADP67957.1 dsRNA-binding protein, putative ribosome maturation factor (YrdC) [Buchnera aphidicola str. JF98 (Acyrthos
MDKHCFLNSLLYCIKMLHNDDVIAYPTESMFGLGCDPNSKKAVKKLLNLKNRSIEKGLILVASDFDQIKMYVNENILSNKQKKKIFFHWPGPFTFLLPAKPNTPYWLTGKFNTVAVRVSAHFEIIKLCNAFGQAVVSTSANISNMTPCFTSEEVFKCFGKDFPLLNGKIGNEKNPSKIINIINGKLIRYV